MNYNLSRILIVITVAVIGTAGVYFWEKGGMGENHSSMVANMSRAVNDTVITIHADQATGAKKSMQGLLAGVDYYRDGMPPAPPELKDLVPPLKIKFWRVPEFSQYLVAHGLAPEAKIAMIGVNGYDAPLPGEIGEDYAKRMERLLEDKMREAKSKGYRIDYWDLVNGPDGLAGPIVSRQLEFVKRLILKARSVDPTAKIVAPSFDVYDNTIRERLDAFLAMLAQNNLHVEGLSWHEFGPPEYITLNVAYIRNLIQTKYADTSVCRPQCPEIHINEFQGSENFLHPGWILGYLHALEESNVDFASKACWWDIPTIEGGDLYNACATGLDGLLYIDGKTPEPAYWLHSVYSAFADRPRLVTTSSESKIITLATKDDATRQFRILVGRYDGSNSDVTIKIVNYPYSQDTVMANIEKYPALPLPLRPLPEPVALPPQTLTINRDGSLTIPLAGFKDGDAYSILLSESKPFLHLSFDRDLKGAGGEIPTRQKNAPLTVQGQGIEGKAVRLEEGSELAYSSNATNFNKDFGTVEFWFKPTTWDTDGQIVHRLFDVRFRCTTQGCLNYMVLDVNHDTKEMYFLINDCDCPWPSPNSIEAKISTLPTSNQWHHIAATWDRTKGSKLYLDGKRVAEDTSSFLLRAPLPHTDPVGGIMLANPELTPIGTLKPGSLVDEFRIDPYPKSDTEIKADYDRLRKDQSLAIAVNAGKVIGELPHLYRAGIWIQRPSDLSLEYIISKFFAENQVGEIQMGVSGALSWSKDFEDYKQALTNGWKIPEYLVEPFKASGQRMLVSHFPGPLPEWLSSRAGDERSYTQLSNIIRAFSPPKCYDYRCTRMEEITCYTQRCRDITAEQLAKDGFVYGWASVVDYFLRYFYETLGVKNLGYYVGHEQNKDWIGTEEEFYKTYEYTAKAAKNVSPTIAIGGSGAWGWDAKRLPCDPNHYSSAGMEICRATQGWAIDGEHCKDVEQNKDNPSCEPMNKNLLQYAKARSIPIDFLNYHMFGDPVIFGPHTDTRVDAMQKWLRENGFDVALPLYPADWTVWSGFPYPADYLDTSYVPPYIIGSLVEMARAGIQWHSHDFDVLDGLRLEGPIIDQRGKDTQFIGDWAIFTRDYVIKPAYNAFTALSIFAGKEEQQTPNEVETAITGDNFVMAVAASQTKNKKTTRVLFSNFPPSADVVGARNAYIPYLGSALKSCMLSKSYSEEEYKSIISSLQAAAKKNPPQGGMTLEYVKRLVANTISDPKTKEDLLWCAEHDVLEMKQAIDRYAKEPREVSLSISGLAPGSYRIKKYLIDADHSNSCRYNKKTEPQTTNTPCGINGQIDQRVARAKAEAKQKGREEGFAYLRKQGYTDRDLASGKQIVQSCKRKMACIQGELEKNYQKLDRCKLSLKLPPGSAPAKSCSSADTVISELKTAIGIYRDAYARVLFYDSPDAIDKINNLSGVRLEVVEQTITRVNDDTWREALKLTPHAVLLMELEQL